MVTDKWLTAIGSATQTLFWAIGYFFGFTLITVLTAGLLVPGSFPGIGKPRRHGWHLVSRCEGRFYLASEAVAVAGWLFLIALNAILIRYLSGYTF